LHRLEPPQINTYRTRRAALAALSVSDAENLVQNSLLAATLSFEALKVTSKAFDKRIHELRPHRGQLESAHHIRALIQKSKIIDSMKKKVQDDYSIRCTPQVLGASAEL